MIHMFSADGDSLDQFHWRSVENGDDVVTYEPGTNPVYGPGYEDNIRAIATGLALMSNSTQI